MSGLSSVMIVALGVTLLIVLSGARIIGVKLTRRHALPIMAVMGAGLTLIVLIETGQLPLPGLSLGAMIRILWKPGLINAGAVFGIYIVAVSIKDHWHPPQFIEYRNSLIPTKWVIGILTTGLVALPLAWLFFLVFHRVGIFLWLMAFGVWVTGKALGVYLFRDKARDVERQKAG